MVQANAVHRNFEAGAGKVKFVMEGLGRTEVFPAPQWMLPCATGAGFGCAPAGIQRFTASGARLSYARAEVQTHHCL